MSATNYIKVKSFADALAYLGHKSERPLAHNTRIELNSGNVEIRYHGSAVVTFTPNDDVILSSCGWKTSTTKERLNWCVPDGFYVYQERSIWYLEDRQARVSYIFQDGITIHSDRSVTEDNSLAESDDTKQTIKAIHKFVTGYVKALLNGEIDKPSGGDCWYCYMQTDDGESLGDKTNNTNHILSHFEESYFVPSMIYNAFKHNNRLSRMSQDGIARLTDESLRCDVSEWQKDITARDVKACLTAYLKHVLNIAQ